MEFKKLAEILSEIESTTKRLEIVDLISKFFKTVGDEIKYTVYLLQGKVAPDYEGIELGIAEKQVIKVLSVITGKKEDFINQLLIKVGDLGQIAEDLLKEKKQASLFSEKLTITKVYNNLLELANKSGSGSQLRKQQLLQDLLQNADPLEAKYIVRIVLERLRIGLADMTIVDAIAIAFGKKEDADIVERAYNIHPDLAEIAYIAYTRGIDGIKSIKITPGIPVRSMLAERLPSLEEILQKMGGVCSMEYKYDGLRLQAHKFGDKIKLFSRRLEDVTEQFPEIAKEIREFVKAETAILDGEAVPYNLDTGEMLPFQAVSQRRGRKYDVYEMAERIPVVVFFFDIIYKNGNDLTVRPYPDRKVELKNSIKEGSLRIRLAKNLIVSRTDDAEKFFNEALEAGCEGIVAKNINENSIYRAGAREYLWIKYKRDYQLEMQDTVDLVVVGAFSGQGRRAGSYGALLMAVYSRQDGTFKTVCKLGSGFTDEQLDNLPRLFQKYILKERDPRVESQMIPDFWIEPHFVLEVKGAEITLSPIHTCCYGLIKEGSGLAIRFPRFTGRWREDKSPEDATTEDEILEMYHSQKKKIIQDNPG
jgi:DNA ligase-1